MRLLSGGSGIWKTRFRDTGFEETGFRDIGIRDAEGWIEDAGWIEVYAGMLILTFWMKGSWMWDADRSWEDTG